MKRWIFWGLLLAAALFAVLPFVFFSFSPNYNYCAGHEGSYYTGERDSDGAAKFSEPILGPTFGNLILHCGAVYVTQNANGLTALATVLLTVITVLMAVIGAGQWFSTAKATNHLEVTERAYIRVSHEAPGVKWVTPNGPKFRVSMQIKNMGHTPARVTDAVFNFILVPPGMVVDDLPPSVPATEIGKDTASFLMTGDAFYQHQTLSLDDDKERADLDAAKVRMIYYGYVDYIDQFNVRHRAGYGRSYNPAFENNLVFPDRGPFNYDRKRKRGEGLDWDWTLT